MTTKLNVLMHLASHFLAVDTVEDSMKKRAIEDYKKALKMPRKKKKKAKREALLDYSFACWNPFENF